MNRLKLPFYFKPLAVAISGICFYFGFELSGDYGWLLWIAPIPIFYVSLFVKPKSALFLAFIAYTIGRLSWLGYLLLVLPVPLAIAFTLLLPIVFALVVVFARKIHLIARHWFTVLAFPILFTAFEYLLFLFSKDGTAASIAYHQSNYITFIQVASITGILGITFQTTLFPSAIALIFYWRRNSISKQLAALLGIVYGVVFIFGWIRLNEKTEGQTRLLGLVTIDESNYKGAYQHDRAKENLLTELYLQETSKLADLGAQTILLPEKAIFVNDSNKSEILNRFSRLAADRKIKIVLGATDQKTGYYLNNAWVFGENGKILSDYQKVNLFEGEAIDGCKPGKKTHAIFNSGTMNEGVAICKDMDFQQFIQGYSIKSPGILYVPAWDFVVDGWMHSRMAILRCVEGGFALVRNARQGRLTINDWRGNILSEENSESGNRTVLLGKLFAEPHPTIYAKAGDWLGMLCLLASLGLIVYELRQRKKIS